MTTIGRRVSRSATSSRKEKSTITRVEIDDRGSAGLPEEGLQERWILRRREIHDLVAHCDLVERLLRDRQISRMDHVEWFVRRHGPFGRIVNKEHLQPLSGMMLGELAGEHSCLSQIGSGDDRARQR